MAEPSAPIDVWTGPDAGTRFEGAWLQRQFSVLGGWLLAERDRWILWVPVFVGIGVLVYFGLPLEPPLWPGFALGGGLLLAAHLVRRQAVVSLSMIAVALVALGFGVACLRTAVVAAPVLSMRVGPTTLVGTVMEAGIDPRHRKLVLGALEIGGLPAAMTPERVRVTVRSSSDMRDAGAGDRVRLRVVLSPPP